MCIHTITPLCIRLVTLKCVMLITAMMLTHWFYNSMLHT